MKKLFERELFRRRAVLFVCCLALLGLFPACKRVTKVVRSTIPGASGTSQLEVQVHISPGANKNNPVAFDLVLVTDKKLLMELTKLTASEWFEKRNQIQLDYPKETELGTRRWEWVPGQLVKLPLMPVKLEIVGGIVFANYFTPGAHRALINPRKAFRVDLGAEDFTVKPLKE